MPPDSKRDLWPFSSMFAAVDSASGERQDQTITVLNYAAALEIGAAASIDHGPDGCTDPAELMIVVVEENHARSDTVATLVVTREHLLRHTINVMQRLVADLGAERAREVMRSVGGYPLPTRGGVQ